MESTTLRVARIKSIAGTAQQSNVPCARQIDMAWLGAIGAAGLSVDGWSKNGGGTHQTQPLVLVPEAGIEPAWSFWNRGILSPLRLPISPLRRGGRSGGTLASGSRSVKVGLGACPTLTFLLQRTAMSDRLRVGANSLARSCLRHRSDR